MVLPQQLLTELMEKKQKEDLQSGETYCLSNKDHFLPVRFELFSFFPHGPFHGK